MDHAEVIEAIEEAVAAPGGLARLGADPLPSAVALREHVSTCPSCASEWRSWSLVSLGMAAAVPDTQGPRPELRDRVITAAATRTRSTAGPPADPGSVATGAPTGHDRPDADPRHVVVPPGSGIRLGPRRARDRSSTPGSARPRSGPSFGRLLLGAAVTVVLFVAGMALGRTLVGTPETPRGDPGRVLAEAAAILQGGGFGLARLETPEGDAGGVVVVSPGSGRLAVVSTALEEPPPGVRYVCLLDRSGTRTQVGYMRWERTPRGGSLAYWAGDAEPPDLGMTGDVLIVELDTPDAQPALVGEFPG